MSDNKKTKGLIKKAIAVTLGITMAFGMLMLPNSAVKNEFTAACAYTYEEDGVVYTYSIEQDKGMTFLALQGAENHGDTLNVPSTITHDGVEYPVYMIDSYFLKDDTTIKNVVFPESVKRMGMCILQGSTVENITLPNGLERLGVLFAARCPNLNSVNYDGTSIKGGNLEWNTFSGSNLSGVTNEKGAVCLGNWLIKYTPASDATELKIADLGNNGVKIENVGYNAVNISESSLTTLDLEGIKYIGDNNFSSCPTLVDVKNTESITNLGSSVLSVTPWYENAKKQDLFRIGTNLIHYKTDSDTLDLTSEPLKGITHLSRYAFSECKNVTKLYCSSDTQLTDSLFYVDYKQSGDDESMDDPLPKKPTYKIKEVYVDGKKLEYSPDNPKVSPWLRNNIYYLKGTPWLMDTVDAKMKDLFRQMDIQYFGFNNDKVGTLSKTEEFYALMKIHSYISTFDYDHDGSSAGELEVLLNGGKLTCGTYADMECMLCECAGIGYKEFSAADNAAHAWDSVQIGDEWFESDSGWNAQSGHHFGWFALSTDGIYAKDSVFHKLGSASASWRFSKSTVRDKAHRTLGDIDGNELREQNDVDLLWDYIKGRSKSIDKKAADVNFDGTIDVTDAVLLENFMNGTAIDTDNIPTDGLAPSVKIAFLNGTDYDNIKYAFTDREGYITLPDDIFEAPEGMKLHYDIGRVGQKVRLTNPFTVVQVSFVDKNTPDYILGDVTDDGLIDIEDAVAIIQHINGVTPLDEEQELRADVSKDKKIDIDDAVTLISYINGNSTF